jgi:2',3'-cyclic-nucleotide 2'-phosphodiesterase (5'-nucleotidase family)
MADHNGEDAMVRAPSRWAASLASAALAAALSSCAPAERASSPADAAPAPAEIAAARAGPGFAIVAINDVYRIAGLDGGERGGLARVRALRAALEARHPAVLLLHAGDFLAPSFLSRTYDGAQMIDVLNGLDGRPDRFDPLMFVVFGNHEFDKAKPADAALLDRRIDESRFTWLGSNVEFARGADGAPVVAGPNLIDSEIVVVAGVKVGIFGLTTDVKHPAYVASFADRLATARDRSRLLRGGGADVVIAVTHQLMSEDLEILERLGDRGPDLIIGGHEHTRMKAWVGDNLVVKADADALTASVVEVALDRARRPRFAHRYETLGGATPPPDPGLDAVVQGWVDRHNRDFCAALEPPQPDTCLDAVLSRAGTTLVAEETKIRSVETNLGDWIADQALAAFHGQGAQVAFINAGSLRLNYDIAAGEPILRRHVEELFAFPTDLRLIEIDGRTLKRVVSHGVTEWPGTGRWLQIAGMALRHDPQRTRADRLTLFTDAGARPVRDDEKIRAVTGTYLIDETGDQDGYRMLNSRQVVPGAPRDRTLKAQVMEALEAAGDFGIAPEVEGRICQVGRAGPCLAAP